MKLKGRNFIFFIIIFLFISSNAGCKEKSLLEPLTLVPEDAEVVFAIKNLNEFSNAISSYIKKFDTSLSVLRLLNIWFGFDFTSPENLKKNGFDPKRSLVLYSKKDTLIILAGVSNEKKAIETIKERLRRNGFKESSKGFYSKSKFKGGIVFKIKDGVAFLLISLNPSLTYDFLKPQAKLFINTSIYENLKKQNSFFSIRTNKLFTTGKERGILGNLLGNYYFIFLPLFMNLGDIFGYIDVRNNSLNLNAILSKNIFKSKDLNKNFASYSSIFKDLGGIIFLKIPKNTILSIPQFLLSQLVKNFSLNVIHPLLANIDPFNDVLMNIKEHLIIGITNFDDTIKPVDILNHSIKLKDRLQKIHTFIFLEVLSKENFLKTISKVASFLEPLGYTFKSKKLGNAEEFEIKAKGEEFSGIFIGEKLLLVTGKGETNKRVRDILQMIEKFLNLNKNTSIYLELNPHIFAKKMKGRGFPLYYVNLFKSINKILLKVLKKEEQYFFSFNITLK